MPPQEQLFACIYLFQMLSNYYSIILLFRYDEATQTFFILAENKRQEELQIVIFSDGEWRFIDDETRL